MTLWQKIRGWLAPAAEEAQHLRYGRIGEEAARRHLRKRGLKCLVRNFRSLRGEIDLICRDSHCLVFVEVKTRSSERWGRPSAAVDGRKRRRLTRAAFDYLRLLGRPDLNIRFDVVEVILAQGEVREVRHLENCFSLSEPYRYG